MDIPLNLQQACKPGRAALLIYDMQNGIFSQAPQLRQVVPRVVDLLQAARSAKFPVFFTQHTGMPKAIAGVSQLRTAMIWQRITTPHSVKIHFLPGSQESGLIEELRPMDNEVVFKKFSMSAFVGTPLSAALHDLGLKVVIIAGVVLEIGILPTILHAIDLGFIPVVVTDACGSTDVAIRQYVLDYISYISTAIVTDAATLISGL